MRAVAAILLVLSASAGVSADECGGSPPLDKRAEPTVPYTVRMVPLDVMTTRCGLEKIPNPVACAFPDPTDTEGLHWTILMWDRMPTENLHCVTLYEKSHLPPNLWESPDAYTPADYAKWLAYVEAYPAYEKAYLEWERQHGEAYRAHQAARR
jgi:hypothetical protein